MSPLENAGHLQTTPGGLFKIQRKDKSPGDNRNLASNHTYILLNLEGSHCRLKSHLSHLQLRAGCSQSLPHFIRHAVVFPTSLGALTFGVD